MIPFFEEHDVKLLRMLTDRGSEFCGNPERHEYELYLAVEDIDHSRTKTKSPQTNGICERFHKAALNEFYRVAFRKKVYRSSDELQADLDAWIKEYNKARPHQGRWCFGKTPTDLLGRNTDDEGENDRRLTVTDTKTCRSTRHQLSDRVPANTDQALDRLVVFDAPGLDEGIERRERILLGLGHPDLLQCSLGLKLLALRQLVEDIGGLVHPAALPARVGPYLFEGLPKPSAPSATASS
jgi:hypothetical protein